MEIHSIETEAPLTEAGTHSIVMKTRQAEAEAHSTEAEATMAEETEMAAVLFDRLEDHASHK